MPERDAATKPLLPTPPQSAEILDEELLVRARAGDRLASELLMRRHNRRVYRAVRAVLRSADEVEDVMQQTYVSAFSHLDQFHGNARFSTWLCRIAFNEALARVRQRGRFVSIDTVPELFGSDLDQRTAAADPEREMGARELGRFVEVAVDGLADIYRSVLIFREIEGLTTSETALILGVEENVVKTRLHRARALVRQAIEQRIGQQLGEAYAFEAPRCDRVVAAVLARLPVLPRPFA